MSAYKNRIPRHAHAMHKKISIEKSEMRGSLTTACWDAREGEHWVGWRDFFCLFTFLRQFTKADWIGFVVQVTGRWTWEELCNVVWGKGNGKCIAAATHRHVSKFTLHWVKYMDRVLTKMRPDKKISRSSAALSVMMTDTKRSWQKSCK